MDRSRRYRFVALLLLVAALSTACSQVVELEYAELDAVPREPPEQSFVYDSEGTQLAVLRREYRERIPLDEVPSHLVEAVLAAEDRRFRHHAGIDARAIARAALRNVATGEIEQGGSTITQQLVKNLYMPNAPRTPGTKLQEALIARRLEEEHDKDWILEEYLNTVYFGSGAHGIQAAAETYWRKDARQLTLEESALLAAIIRSPEALDPHTSTDTVRQRRDAVLDAMADLGSVPADAAAAAKAQPVRVEDRPPLPEVVEPHWVDLVTRWLLDEPSFGATREERAARLYGGGLRIHTTLDRDLQRLAREAIAARLGGPDDPEAALTTVDPATGRILAAAHALPYAEEQFDLATQARRQPGSTFKTFVLAAAVSSGMGPDHEVDSSQGRLELPDGGVWEVRNYTRRSYGTIPLREATRASVNTVFARLALELGVPRVAAMARSMGVASPIPDDPQISIGGGSLGVTTLDMAAGYATLANLGERIPAHPIDRIEDADGNVVWRPDTAPRPSLSPSAAFVVTDMLRGVVERGTGVHARIPGWQVAGKTGTTSNYTDAWFSGYTATLSTAVWVGYPDRLVEMRNVAGERRVTGGTVPARIWSDYMERALEGVEPVEFSLPPDGYEIIEIDPETGLRAAPWCPGEPTPVPRAVVPRETCPSPEPAPPPSRVPGPTPSATATGTVSPGPSPAPSEPDPAPTATAEPTPAPSPPPDPTPADTGKPSPTPSPSGGG